MGSGPLLAPRLRNLLPNALDNACQMRFTYVMKSNTTSKEANMTFGTITNKYGQTFGTTSLSDGRTLMIGKYGWAILDGDSQAGSEAIRDEAWKIHAIYNAS
jgi:hypothetical protein